MLLVQVHLRLLIFITYPYTELFFLRFFTSTYCFSCLWGKGIYHFILWFALMIPELMWQGFKKKNCWRILISCRSKLLELMRHHIKGIVKDQHKVQNLECSTLTLSWNFDKHWRFGHYRTVKRLTPCVSQPAKFITFSAHFLAFQLLVHVCWSSPNSRPR